MSHNPHERQSFVGGAAPATLTANILATDLTIPISTAAGWPDGTNGPFLIVLDPGGAEEKVRVTSRSGNTLTVAATSDRGDDNTTAQDHNSGVTVRPCYGAVHADEANDLVHQTLGQITGKGQLPASTGPAQIGLLTSPADGGTYAVVTDDSASTGFGLASFADPTDVAALAASIATLNTEVAALQTTETAEEAAWTAYTPTITGFTVGTGATLNFRYKQIGKTVIAKGAIILGTTPSASGNLNITLPVAAKSETVFRMLGRADFVAASGNRYTGTLVNVSTTAFCVIDDNRGVAPAQWGTSVPVGWGGQSGLELDFEFSYEAA